MSKDVINQTNNKANNVDVINVAKGAVGSSGGRFNKAKAEAKAKVKSKSNAKSNAVIKDEVCNIIGRQILNTLHDKAGARKRKKKALGRGIGSGKGKTCGRGGKGQTARSGVALNGFEGGQLPMYRRVPKRGFNNINRNAQSVLGFDDIQRLLDEKRLVAEKITLEDLKIAGVYDGSSRLKLLSNGECSKSFNVEVHSVSKSAKIKLIKINANAVIIEYNPNKCINRINSAKIVNVMEAGAMSDTINDLTIKKRLRKKLNDPTRSDYAKSNGSKHDRIKSKIAKNKTSDSKIMKDKYSKVMKDKISDDLKKSNKKSSDKNSSHKKGDE